MTEQPQSAGCALCADLEVVRYARDAEAKPRPHCGRCKREFRVELVEWTAPPPRLPGQRHREDPSHEPLVPPTK